MDTLGGMYDSGVLTSLPALPGLSNVASRPSSARDNSSCACCVSKVSIDSRFDIFVTHLRVQPHSDRIPPLCELVCVLHHFSSVYGLEGVVVEAEVWLEC